MFDLTQESPISFEVAAQVVNAHFTTVFRWASLGSKDPSGKRVKLEAIRLGGRWVTSRESLRRFSEALTPRLDDVPTKRRKAVTAK
jgi:hypothetical protein